jgi:hypothetical protein
MSVSGASGCAELPGGVALHHRWDSKCPRPTTRQGQTEFDALHSSSRHQSIQQKHNGLLGEAHRFSPTLQEWVRSAHLRPRTATDAALALLDDRQRVQRRLGDVSGGVVHRPSCRLDLVVSVWLNVLTRLKADGGCRMGARRVDRETAESVTVVARQRLVL